jgi:hypothetical protein
MRLPTYISKLLKCVPRYANGKPTTPTPAMQHPQRPINTSPHLSVSSCSWYRAHLAPLHGLHASHFLNFLDGIGSPPAPSVVSMPSSASHLPRPSSQPAIPTPPSTQRVQNARQHSSHATAPHLGGSTSRQLSQARAPCQVSGHHMRRRWRAMAWAQGRLSRTHRSRRKAACHVSMWLSTRRSVFLKAKRSSTSAHSGADSRICSYSVRVSLGVSTLLVLSASSLIRSTTALRSPSKHSRSASAYRCSSV